MELNGVWAFHLRMLNSKVKTKVQGEDTTKGCAGRLKFYVQTSDLRPQTSNIRPAQATQSHLKATKSLRNWGVPQSENEKSTSNSKNL